MSYTFIILTLLSLTSPIYARKRNPTFQQTDSPLVQTLDRTGLPEGAPSTPDLMALLNDPSANAASVLKGDYLATMSAFENSMLIKQCKNHTSGQMRMLDNVTSTAPNEAMTEYMAISSFAFCATAINSQNRTTSNTTFTAAQAFVQTLNNLNIRIGSNTTSSADTALVKRKALIQKKTVSSQWGEMTKSAAFRPAVVVLSVITARIFATWALNKLSQSYLELVGQMMFRGLTLGDPQAAWHKKYIRAVSYEETLVDEPGMYKLTDYEDNRKWDYIRVRKNPLQSLETFNPLTNRRTCYVLDLGMVSEEQHRAMKVRHQTMLDFSWPAYRTMTQIWTSTVAKLWKLLCQLTVIISNAIVKGVQMTAAAFLGPVATMMQGLSSGADKKLKSATSDSKVEWSKLADKHLFDLFSGEDYNCYFPENCERTLHSRQ